MQTRVDSAIAGKFKDQKLVDIETSQAVAERVHGWAKIFAFFVALPVAALLLLLTVAGIEKYSDFTKMVEKASTQAKIKIDQTRSDVEQAQSRANEAKSKADEAAKTADAVTAQVNRQLGSATEVTKNVHALSSRVAELEKQTSSQMSASTQHVEARVSDLDRKIDAAVQDLGEQQKKLASTDELVKALFSKGRTELFPMTGDSPRTVIIPSKIGAIVFMLLSSAPIYQTLELKWRVASQPRGSYTVNNNVVIFFWGDPAANLKAYPMEVTYVPDPTSKAPFKTLVLKDKIVFADDTQMMDVTTVLQ